MKELLYKDITYEIRGACFWVWKAFGGAFKEKVIDRALTIELRRRGLKVDDQKRIDIYYEGKKVGIYIPDKIIEDKVLLEIKCKEYLMKEDIDQFWKYLKGSEYKVGILVNFGPKKLTIKRIVYDTARDRRQISVVDPRQICGKGFTLLELLISIAIFGLISVFSIVNFRAGAQGRELQMAAEEVLAQIREAQTMSLTGRVINLCFGGSQAGTICQEDKDCGSGGQCQPQTPRGGYGVHFEGGKNELIIFADLDTGNYLYEVGELIPNGEKALPANIEISNLNFSPLDIVFEPPSGRLLINGLDRGQAEIILKHLLKQATKTIIINGISGQMEIE